MNKNQKNRLDRIKQFSHDLDPSINIKEDILEIEAKPHGSVSLIGNLLMVFGLTILILIMIKNNFRYVFAILWVALFFYNLINRIKSLNKVTVDIDKRIIRIVANDPLRKIILKKDIQEVPFNKIKSIYVKLVSYGQYEKVNRLKVETEEKVFDLIDFKQYSNTETLSKLLQDIVKS